MAKRLVLVFVVLALVAAAGTVTKLGNYQITFAKAAAVNGTMLKPGDYRLVVGDAKITITPKEGGKAVEAPVKIENTTAKFDSTIVTYDKNNVTEIDLGGSRIKLVFAQ
jgi:hypothetical protein